MIRRWIVAALLLVVLGYAILLNVRPASVETSDHMGWALSFDGYNDFVELPETSAIMGDGWESTKTVSLWIKPEGTINCFMSDPAHCNIIFGDRPRWWGISIGNIAGRDQIWVWNKDASDYDRVGVDYTINEWVHVALVHDNGILRAYRNGHPVGDVPSGPTEQPNEGGQPRLNIGGVIINESNYWTFDGQIDEVRLWNYARSQSQIQQDMYGEIGVDAPGLMAYYKMSDGSGLTLTDDTDNDWDGILHNGARGVPEDGLPPQWVDSTAGDVIIPTPTVTNTPTNTPTPTSDISGTPTPTATGIIPTVTATPTGTWSTPTPTGTWSTPTPTGTRGTPTPTGTPGPIEPALYLPSITNRSSS